MRTEASYRFAPLFGTGWRKAQTLRTHSSRSFRPDAQYPLPQHGLVPHQPARDRRSGGRSKSARDFSIRRPKFLVAHRPGRETDYLWEWSTPGLPPHGPHQCAAVFLEVTANSGRGRWDRYAVRYRPSRDRGTPRDQIADNPRCDP